jgi:hypothetical protein
MQRHSVDVDTSQSKFMAASPAMPKVANPETGEIAVDWQTKQPVCQVAVVVYRQGSLRGDQIVVNVPGELSGIEPGMWLELSGLVARPYPVKDRRSGEVTDIGMTYRAESVTAMSGTAVA